MSVSAATPSPETAPSDIDLAILGAGPHALTLVTYLLHERPQLRQRLAVFDPSGTWLQQWQHQFAAQEIPHLRSPVVHHPDPDPFALRRFAESSPGQLFAPYDLPGTALFENFCQQVVKRQQLQAQVLAHQITHVVTPQRAAGKFRLHLDNGQQVRARRVVMATGTGRPQVPAWVERVAPDYPPERLCHSSQVDLRQLHLLGETVLIVGGGLTSGHLAIGAIARGARVILLSRRQLQEKLFDADPGWVGPKYLKGFLAEPCWHKRHHMIQSARNGGSLTPAVLMQLRRLARAGKLSFHEHCQIENVRWQGHHWQVDCGHRHDQGHEQGLQLDKVDRIWLATGYQVDARQQPLLKSVLENYPTELVSGLPVLEDCLRWPGCNLFVMGGLAALQVGPTARNLSGAIKASRQIVPALIKPKVFWHRSAC